MVEALAAAMSAADIEKAVDEYLEIGGFLEAGLRRQTLFDLDAFERATGRVLPETKREEFVRIQAQANRWTYLGSGMSHPNFLATLEQLNPASRTRIEQIAPVFC